MILVNSEKKQGISINSATNCIPMTSSQFAEIKNASSKDGFASELLVTKNVLLVLVDF